MIMVDPENRSAWYHTPGALPGFIELPGAVFEPIEEATFDQIKPGRASNAGTNPAKRIPGQGAVEVLLLSPR
jgi:hypothetical protein